MVSAGEILASEDGGSEERYITARMPALSIRNHPGAISHRNKVYVVGVGVEIAADAIVAAPKEATASARCLRKSDKRHLHGEENEYLCGHCAPASRASGLFR